MSSELPPTGPPSPPQPSSPQQTTPVEVHGKHFAEESKSSEPELSSSPFTSSKCLRLLEKIYNWFLLSLAKEALDIVFAPQFAKLLQFLGNRKHEICHWIQHFMR